MVLIQLIRAKSLEVCPRPHPAPNASQVLQSIISTAHLGLAECIDTNVAIPIPSLFSAEMSGSHAFQN